MLSRRKKPLIPEIPKAPGVPADLVERWYDACRKVYGPKPYWALPQILEHRQTPAGDRLTVQLPSGWTPAVLSDRAGTLASVLQVRAVRAWRHAGGNTRMAEVVIVTCDPLAAELPDSWPLLGSQGPLSFWDRIPVGLDEDGEHVSLSLIERNLLLGGEPGSGKSVAASMPVAVAALDPNVRLILLDGKLVELAVWEPVAEVFVDKTIDRAVEVLTPVVEEMHRRYAVLKAQRRRKLTRADGWPIWVVVIDELAFYFRGKPNLESGFGKLLYELVTLGRAAGVIVIAATQRPSSTVVPTDVRDMFALRWAFRTTTPDSSDTILGRGWSKRGVTSSAINVEDRGVGYLLAEGALPKRLRTYNLTDDHLQELADRAVEIRSAPPDEQEDEVA